MSIVRKNVRAWLLMLLLTCALGAQASTKLDQLGVLVVAPDRGFLGNQEVRDAFAQFAQERKAALLFVTDERSEKLLDQRLQQLDDDGAKQLVVLPLVVSEANARWQLVKRWLQARQSQGEKLHLAPVYGSSYLAVEDLAQRLRAAPSAAHAKDHHQPQALLLVGYGAASETEAASMQADLLRVGRFASSLDADKVTAVVYPARHAADAKRQKQQFAKIIKQAQHKLVVPLAMAPRSDSMMVFARWFARDLPKSAQLLDSALAPAAALSQWMQLAFNRASLALVPPTPEQVGVVALAHGADWFWNEDIRQAVAPVAEHHPLAYAFTMADQAVIGGAVAQLQQQQDLRAIVVVRAFGMASSFRPSIERMLGQDVNGAGEPAHHAHAMMMAMHGMDDHADMSVAAKSRIRSAVPLLTLGGVENNPLFAKALLTNARAISKNPAKETLILVAHGAGADDDNAHWLHLLHSLAGQMQAESGYNFAAIHTATWREDWPEKNKQAVQQVRKLVQDITAQGGRALVVPARINGQGAADRYLKGLDYGWGQGFVQTPYFADWFEQQVQLGLAQLQAE